MRVGSPQLRAVLAAGSYDTRWVMDVAYNGERVLADVDVIDVSQVEDGTSKVQQYGSLTIIWQDAFGRSIAPVEMEDLLSPFGTTVTLYMVVSSGPMFAEKVAMGGYTITDVPEITSTRWRLWDRTAYKGDALKIAFKDPFYKVQRNRFDTPGVTPSLTSGYAEIQRLTRLPITRNPQVPDRSLSRAMIYEEDRLDAVYEIAGALDAVPYMTADGTVSLRPNAWGPYVDTISAENADPVTRDIVPATYSAWAESGRNYAVDPRGTRVAAWAQSLGALSLRTDMPGDIPTAIRWTRTTAGAARVGHVIGTTMPGGGQAIRVQLRVWASEPMTLTVTARPSLGSTTGQAALGTVNVPAGISDIDLTGASFTAATTSTSGINLSTSSGAVDSILDMTRCNVELAANARGYLDGFTAGTLLVRHRFVGALNASASVQETRTVTNPELIVPRPRGRGTLLSVKRGMSAEGVYNRVVVRAQGQQPGVLAAREVGEGYLRAQNQDGSDSPFGRVPYFISSQLITTTGQAEEVANARLPRLARPQAVVLEIEELVNPLREVGDVVRVRRLGETVLARVRSVRRNSSKTQQTSVVMQG